MSGGAMRSHKKCKKSKSYDPNSEICKVCGWMQVVDKETLFPDKEAGDDLHDAKEGGGEDE